MLQYPIELSAEGYSLLCNSVPSFYYMTSIVKWCRYLWIFLHLQGFHFYEKVIDTVRRLCSLHSNFSRHCSMPSLQHGLSDRRFSKWTEFFSTHGPFFWELKGEIWWVQPMECINLLISPILILNRDLKNSLKIDFQMNMNFMIWRYSRSKKVHENWKKGKNDNMI